MANIDSVKLPNGNEYNLQDVVSAKGSQPNLLINGWFTVNQRSFSSQTMVDTRFYTVDRWQARTAGAYSINSSGLSLTSGCVINQYFEDEQWSAIVGKMVTMSVLLSDGTIHSGSAVVSSSANTPLITDGSAVTDSGLNLNNKMIAIPASASCTIRAVKLEIGSTSTLHLDTAPDYSTELMKCQRYFRRIAPGAAQIRMFQGYARTATTFWFQYYMPIPMRVAPTISSAGQFAIDSSSGYYTATISNDVVGTNFATIVATISASLSVGTNGLLYNTGASDYIDLNAEL